MIKQFKRHTDFLRKRVKEMAGEIDQAPDDFNRGMLTGFKSAYELEIENIELIIEVWKD